MDKTLPGALLGLCLLVSGACAGASPGGADSGGTEQAVRRREPEEAPAGRAELPEILEEMAELERSRGFIKGMGLAESGIREKDGDLAGAVIAAYKELSFAYGYGGVSAEGLAEGIEKTAALFAGKEGAAEESALLAARGIGAFLGAQWDEAAALLRKTGSGAGEADGFVRWMLLVCALEAGEKGPPSSEYGAIRARYRLFPEYWYRGARFFRGNIGAEYAEECINLNPQGPFAPECRNILAQFLGLGEGGEAIRSRAEIEGIVGTAVSSADPLALRELLPLIGLPDNTYTLYALGVLKGASGAPGFRQFFLSQLGQSTGRLTERLNFILRGQG
jgi:hypothetical protein